MTLKRLLVVGLVALLACSALAQRGQGRGFGFGRNRGGATALVGREDVQKELKLSDDQLAKINALNQDLRDKRMSIMQSHQGDFPAALKEMEPVQEEANKKLADILNADQNKRLKELRVQMLGSTAVLEKDLQADLELTDAQKEQLAAIDKKHQDANQDIMRRMRDQEIMREEATQEMQDDNAAMLKEIDAVLTDAQKQKLKDMAGAKFEFQRQGRGGGGR